MFIRDYKQRFAWSSGCHYCQDGGKVSVAEAGQYVIAVLDTSPVEAKISWVVYCLAMVSNTKITPASPICMLRGAECNGMRGSSLTTYTC